ncbi:hypothetical protein [Streptomyces sp. NPDC047009]
MFEDDTTLGVYVTEDPAACRARDAARHHAVPIVKFAQRVRFTG